jgi:hypothetical protein
MAILDGRTATEVAHLLCTAAAAGASTGALSMLDEAALAFRAHPGVEPARQKFAEARFAYQREGDARWPETAEAALVLAAALRPLGEARVPEGFNT